MKVSIIGGGGLVGSCAAYRLAVRRVVSGIDLIDVNADLCRGQALDLLHGASLVGRPADPVGGLRGDPRERPRSASPPACAASPTRAGST